MTEADIISDIILASLIQYMQEDERSNGSDLAAEALAIMNEGSVEQITRFVHSFCGTASIKCAEQRRIAIANIVTDISREMKQKK